MHVVNQWWLVGVIHRWEWCGGQSGPTQRKENNTLVVVVVVDVVVVFPILNSFIYSTIHSFIRPVLALLFASHFKLIILGSVQMESFMFAVHITGAVLAVRFAVYQNCVCATIHLHLFSTFLCHTWARIVAIFLHSPFPCPVPSFSHNICS